MNEQRLRGFVLDLAVRGKLVAQDAEDEPATTILRSAAATKESAKSSIQSLEPVIDTMPFELPPGWAWSSVGELCSKTGSGSTPRGGQTAYQPSGIPFLRSQNVYNDGLRLDDVANIDYSTHTRMAVAAVKPNDSLLNITGGSIGRCCRVPADLGEANISQHVAILRVSMHWHG